MPLLQCATISAPSNAPESTLHDLEELRSHFWGKNRVHRVGTVETIDIYNISQFYQNPSIILLTGQSGIGKFFQRLKSELIKLDRQDLFLVLCFSSTPRAANYRPSANSAMIRLFVRL